MKRCVLLWPPMSKVNSTLKSCSVNFQRVLKRFMPHDPHSRCFWRVLGVTAWLDPQLDPLLCVFPQKRPKKDGWETSCQKHAQQAENLPEKKHKNL